MSSQHEWEATFSADQLGRPISPSFHRLLMLELTRTPTADDAARLERALRQLERRYRHGPSGVLMLIGWGPGYFSRHTAIEPPIGGPVALSRDEEAGLQDIDACVHLAADDEQRLETVVAALFSAGALDLRDPLQLREVRRGFVGSGLPTRRVRSEIPADSPLLLGFHSGLRRNQASEAEVTTRDGWLAGGTTMHVSRIALDLERWYELDAQSRTALMYGPTVTPAQAANLSDDPPADYDRLPETARAYGVVGHAQAAARARLGDRPRLNRRDFATTDGGIPGTHFVSLQRSLDDFNATRAVMNAADARHHHPCVGLRRRNGINQFMEVRSRATFAVPATADRAFPAI